MLSIPPPPDLVVLSSLVFVLVPVLVCCCPCPLALSCPCALSSCFVLSLLIPSFLSPSCPLVPALVPDPALTLAHVSTANALSFIPVVRLALAPRPVATLSVPGRGTQAESLKLMGWGFATSPLSPFVGGAVGRRRSHQAIPPPRRTDTRTHTRLSAGQSREAGGLLFVCLFVCCFGLGLFVVLFCVMICLGCAVLWVRFVVVEVFAK
jgi:hypothetical protein